MSKVNPFTYSIGTRVRENILCDMLEPRVYDRILDIGCGLGYFTNSLSSWGAKCVGIDLDERCIGYCQDNMVGEYMVADASELPFPGNSFSKILCTEVIEHIDHNESVLSEIVRVVEDKGTVVVTTPCREGIFGTWLKRIGHNSVDSNSHEYHWHKGYSAVELTELLSKFNIRVVAVEYTLVAMTEVMMAVSKMGVEIMRLKKINSQANALEVNGNKVWAVYCKVFPVLLALAKMEQPFSHYLKGHMVIAKGVVYK